MKVIKSKQVHALFMCSRCGKKWWHVQEPMFTQTHFESAVSSRQKLLQVDRKCFFFFSTQLSLCYSNFSIWLLPHICRYKTIDQKLQPTMRHSPTSSDHFLWLPVQNMLRKGRADYNTLTNVKHEDTRTPRLTTQAKGNRNL